MWLLSQTWNKQPFSPCFLPQTTFARLCYSSIRKLLVLSFGFIVVLVSTSLFLQGVSGNLGKVMFLLRVSAINHYYAHLKAAGAAMVALLARLFPRLVSAEQTPSSSNGSVMHTESNNITCKCKWLSIWSQPDKWSLSTCIQHLPTAIKNCIHSADGIKIGWLSILFKDAWGGKHPPKPQTTTLQPIITCNLFSKSSSWMLTFKVIKKQPFNYFFFTHSIFYLQQTHSSIHSEDQGIEGSTLCSLHKHKGNLFFTKENVYG